jgi:hypothetical protein
MFVNVFELKMRGGAWLSAARNWLQWNTRNGDEVIWGSDAVLQPALTVAQVEDLAAQVAAAALNEEWAQPALLSTEEQRRSARRLAMLAQQCERYRQDGEYREAVDWVLQWAQPERDVSCHPGS